MAHIVAKSKQGSDEISNVEWLCFVCHFTDHSSGTGFKFMHF